MTEQIVEINNPKERFFVAYVQQYHGGDSVIPVIAPSDSAAFRRLAEGHDVIPADEVLLVDITLDVIDYVRKVLKPHRVKFSR